MLSTASVTQTQTELFATSCFVGRYHPACYFPCLCILLSFQQACRSCLQLRDKGSCCTLQLCRLNDIMHYTRSSTMLTLPSHAPPMHCCIEISHCFFKRAPCLDFVSREGESPPHNLPCMRKHTSALQHGSCAHKKAYACFEVASSITALCNTKHWEQEGPRRQRLG